MPSSLLTGGAGFIGSHTCDELIKMGHDVTVLDDLSGGFKENVNSRARFVEGSIVDKDLIGRLFDEHCFDFVYHFAAYAAEGLSHFIKRFNYENNLVGTVNLINASVNSDNVKCFVFTSSIAVYGGNQVPMHEETTPFPEDSYGIAKYAVELELKVSYEMFGLPYCIFRPHNVYGERQNIGDRYRNVIGIFMNQIMRGEPLTIFGDGTQSRAFTHVDDVAPILARSVERPDSWGQVFNVGADKPYTVNELADAVSQAMNIESTRRHLQARMEVKHAFSSHDKVREYFGDLVKDVSLEDGIQRMAKWARVHGTRQASEFSDIEIEKNLPPSWVRAAR